MKGRQHNLGASTLAKLKYGRSFSRLEIGSLDILLVTGAVPVAVRDLYRFVCNEGKTAPVGLLYWQS
jgi:hypothetical protein